MEVISVFFSCGILSSNYWVARQAKPDKLPASTRVYRTSLISWSRFVPCICLYSTVLLGVKTLCDLKSTE